MKACVNCRSQEPLGPCDRCWFCCSHGHRSEILKTPEYDAFRQKVNGQMVPTDVEVSASRDVIARSRHIEITRTTTNDEIIAQVVSGLKDGATVRLGRLALGTIDNNAIRYIASDADDSRNDPERWATTARVRMTWSLALDNIIEKLSASFVKAWLSDWSKGPAPSVLP